MALLTIDDLIEEFKLPNLPYFFNNNDERELDEDKCNSAITDAQYTIFSSLKKIGIDYQDVTEDLKRELRKHMLILTRYNFSSLMGSRTEDMKEDLALTNYWLEKVASGKIQLISEISKKSGWQSVRLVF